MELGIEKIIESSNLRDKVYEILKKSIVYQEIQPGEKIDEEAVAKQLGVSRTPIRETLCRLENEGFVKVVPRRCALVVIHSVKRIDEIMVDSSIHEAPAACERRFDVDRGTYSHVASETDGRQSTLVLGTLPNGKQTRVALFGAGSHTAWLEQTVSDIMDGPHVVAILDDYSRAVVAARVFPSDSSYHSLLTLRQAMELYGRPRVLYTDNDSNFRLTRYELSRF